tara:strand:+ start:3009 stop:3215 length:207 start_codon:yes stop_codon:yes gene_type:complete
LNEKINIKINKPVKLLFLKAHRQDSGLEISKIFNWLINVKMKGAVSSKRYLFMFIVKNIIKIKKTHKL